MMEWVKTSKLVMCLSCVVLLGALSACGKKGDLTLPNSAVAGSDSAGQSNNDKKDDQAEIQHKSKPDKPFFLDGLLQ